ncbi:hypothetical protein [Caulobacter sp.]|uniref:hypothetical protein n=1 Tax=Caulobacter sp. TaxID=78 RepID=UPI002B491753|nr:hypothetical protein [Caulobacter sp.]HJV40875.1 hypothetical protein [Caulobacter sp.]
MSIMGLAAGQSIASAARGRSAPSTSFPNPNDPAPLVDMAPGKGLMTSLFEADTANGFTVNLLGPSGGDLDPGLKALLNDQLTQLGAVDTDAGASEPAPDGAPAEGRFFTPNFFHTDLGGGRSIEIHHGPAGQGEYNPAAMRAMIATIEALRHANPKA